MKKFFLATFNAKEETNRFELHEEAEGIINIEKNSDIDKQLKMIHLYKSDLSILQGLQPLVKEHIKDIVDQFYKNIEIEGSLMQIIEENSSVERLQQTLRTHIQEMFAGKIDEEFVQKRKQIAHMHVKIGLKSKWYLSSFQDLLLTLLQIFDQFIHDREQYTKAVQATTKILNFEQQLVLEAFDDEVEYIRDAHEQQKDQILKQVEQTSAELAAISEQTSASTQQVTSQSQQVVHDSKKATEISQQVSSQSLEGKEQLERQQQQMNDIEKSMEYISTEMKQLKTAAEEIGNVVHIVTSISEQTNLLALNASIEAARAGEYGSGFAVVADEVRKLATQTKDSVSNVSELIDSTNGQIKNVSSHVTTIEELIYHGAENMEHINEFFDEIVASMSESKDYSQNIEKEIQRFSTHIQEMNDAIRQVASSASQLNETTV